MKKIFAVLFLISFLAVLAVPLVTAADTSNCCKINRSFKFAGKTWTGGTCYGEVAEKCVKPDGSELCPTATADTDWGVACILNTIYRITDLVFTVLVAIAALMALLGGYNIMTAGGAPDKANKGRDLLLYAILGLIVAFFARAIPSIIALIL